MRCPINWRVTSIDSLTLKSLITNGPAPTGFRLLPNASSVSDAGLIIIDVQRGGPSTGLPTKTEQADLLDRHLARLTDVHLLTQEPPA